MFRIQYSIEEWNKTVGPVFVLAYLGLEIDTINMLIKIPRSKVDILKQIIQNCLAKESTLLRELET